MSVKTFVSTLKTHIQKFSFEKSGYDQQTFFYKLNFKYSIFENYTLQKKFTDERLNLWTANFLKKFSPGKVILQKLEFLKKCFNRTYTFTKVTFQPLKLSQNSGFYRSILHEFQIFTKKISFS